VEYKKKGTQVKLNVRQAEEDQRAKSPGPASAGKGKEEKTNQGTVKRKQLQLKTGECPTRNKQTGGGKGINQRNFE